MVPLLHPTENCLVERFRPWEYQRLPRQKQLTLKKTSFCNDKFANLQSEIYFQDSIFNIIFGIIESNYNSLHVGVQIKSVILFSFFFINIEGETCSIIKY